MKEKIYKAVTENRGYVVNVDYDKFLHWNCEDCTLIILGKGQWLDIHIDSDILTLGYCDPNSTVGAIEKADLNDIVNSLDYEEAQIVRIGSSNNLALIIKKELIVDQIDLEGVVYTSNIYTAEKLLNHFCDKKDFYVELVVPLDNLKLLNRIIKEKPYCIKFVRRIKTNIGDKLGIVTNYNAEDRIKRALQFKVNESRYNSHNSKKDDNIDKFIRDCNYEYSDLSNIVSENELDNLMEQYSETCVDKYKNITRGYLDSDEAYMSLYENLKPIE